MLDEEPYWRVMRAGAEYGAFPESQLRKWIASGKVASDVKLSCGGAWISSDDFLNAQSPQSPLALIDKAPDAAPAMRLTADQPKPAPLAGSDETTIAFTFPPPPPDEPPPTRDHIVILGRRQSGKTIYLATLYSMLWKRLRGISAKALAGAGHRELMNIAQTLADGQWPPATQGLTQIELELEYDGKKRTLITLDFAGELFAKAFLYDRGNARDVKPLLNHLDRAAAVMLLVDPAVTVGRDRDAAMEDDFGLVQAVQRLRNWPEGAYVPVVFILTKSDIHQPIIEAAGGPVPFVRQHFPALARVLQKIKIYQVSAVQCTRDPANILLPSPASTPVNVERPLLYCLGMLEQEEAQEKLRQRQREAQAQAQLQQQQTARREKRQIRWLIAAVALIFISGAAILARVIYTGYLK